MEQNYDNEAVKELLSWAQVVFDNKRYPSGRFQVNKSAAILDCGKYLDFYDIHDQCYVSPNY